MDAPKKRITSLLSHLVSKLDTLCEPNPKYTPQPAQREVNAKRNKVALYVHIFCFNLFLIDHFITGTPLLDCIARSTICFLLVISNLLSCRYHPEIFRIAHGIACVLIGPGTMSSSHSIYIGFALAPVIAPGHFLFTGSLGHAIIQAMIQLLLLNTVYSNAMKASLEDLTPTESISLLTGAITVSFIIQALIFILTHLFFKQAYQKISTMEKADLENQKTLLLSFSHELRNSINSLIGNVKLISLESGLTDRMKKLLLNAEVCSELLVHLVNNILDTGKLEVGELEINPKAHKIRQILESTWSLCSEIIKQKQLYGQMRVCKNLPRTLLIDNYRLTQVFLNLVGNAIKFTEKGSIDMNIDWKAGRSKVTEECFLPYPFHQEEDEMDEGVFDKCQRFESLSGTFILTDTNRSFKGISANINSSECTRGVLKVTILDTGCGMDKQQLSQLFQKFSQVCSDPSRRMLGTGLGLFITKQICQAMSGEIRVYSKKNVGTCFTFCLPVDVAQDSDNRPTDSNFLTTMISSKRLRAMIVDDVPFNHAILNTYFKKLGIEVVGIATNGLEAYNKYMSLSRSGRQPDIIAMDIEMPIMDGKLSSQRIREFEISKNLPSSYIIMVSGNCSGSEIEECVNKDGVVQASDFLKKPVSLEELLRALSHHFIN